MKVLFVHAASEHLGIEYLSGVLKAAGHSTALAFDPAQFSGQENARLPFIARLTDKTPRLVNAAVTSEADLIAFSAYTVNFRWALDIAARIRDKIPTPIAFGGPHVTAAPHRALAYPQVDAVVTGEGEGALLDLLEDMENGNLPNRKIPNVWKKTDDNIEEQPPRPYIRNLDNLPLPDKELFYSKIPAFAENYMIMTSRGCPYRCAFCSNSMYHKLYDYEKNHVRRRSPEGVIEELEHAAGRYRLRTVSFWDDVFTFSRKWLEEFSGLYKKSVGLPYDCYTHPAALDEAKVKLLAESGCFRVKIGLQTVSDPSRQRLLDRAGSAANVARAIELAHKHGVEVGLDHMLGLPGEGKAEQDEAARFYINTRPDRINSYWMLHFPGAEIVKIDREENRLTDEDVEAIEEGKAQTSYMYATPDADGGKWSLRPYQTFFDLQPLLPQSVNRWLERKGLISKLPYHPVLRQLIAAAAAVFQNDRRYRQHLKLLVARKRAP